MVDVVTFQSHVVVASVKIDTPVVVAVARGRPIRTTVDKAVRDGHTLGSRSTENNMLTADTGSSNMVDPDHIAVVDSDSITAPNVLRVDIGNSNVSSHGQT